VTSGYNGQYQWVTMVTRSVPTLAEILLSEEGGGEMTDFDIPSPKRWR